MAEYLIKKKKPKKNRAFGKYLFRIPSYREWNAIKIFWRKKLVELNLRK